MFLLLGYINNESTLKYGQLSEFTAIVSSLFCEKINIVGEQKCLILFLVFILIIVGSLCAEDQSEV